VCVCMHACVCVCVLCVCVSICSVSLATMPHAWSYLWNDRPSMRTTSQQEGSNVSLSTSNCFTYSYLLLAIVQPNNTNTQHNTAQHNTTQHNTTNREDEQNCSSSHSVNNCVELVLAVSSSLSSPRWWSAVQPMMTPQLLACFLVLTLSYRVSSTHGNIVTLTLLSLID
jgi:methionine-rich copper-binding protein CopC